jgi:AcrR family transcriptional regulator
VSAPVDGFGSERGQICEALIETVAERGYQSTNVYEVCDRAGVDRAVFARHFDSLEDCFAAAWEQIDVEIRRRMSAAYSQEGSWQHRLRLAFSAGLEYLGSDQGRARVYVSEVLYVNEAMRDRQREALARLSSTVDLGREEEGAGERTPPGIADAVAGAIWHRVKQLVQNGRGADLPEELSRFMYLAVLPYRGAGAAQSELGET